ncbi:hypothetical protein ACWGQ5_13550 [Streptomyces sp. NPDC055722]
MKGSRVAPLLVGLTAVLTLAGCGVPPSDVIEAGAPASGMFSAGPKHAVPTAVPVYFLHNGDLKPYLRKISDPGDLGTLVRLLFDGPSASEAATAVTKLPHLTDAPTVTIGSDNILAVHLPKDVPPLSHLAMLQLACTVGHETALSAALSSDAPQDGASTAPPVGGQPSSPAYPSVRVLGDGWTMTQSDGECPDPVQP